MKRERLQKDLGDLLDVEIYPALFDRLDSAFPDFAWKKTGKNWTAEEWPSSFPMSVEGPRPDRLMVYADRPWWIKVHGHEGVRFLDLVNGGRKPEGPDFVAAVRRLCDLAGVPFPELERSPEEIEKNQKKEARRSALEALIVHAQEVLWSEAGAHARAYLRDSRGLLDDEIKDLELGLYPDNSDEVSILLAKEDHAQAGKDAALVWSKLEGYVLIPWRDEAGQPLTLYGRWPSKTPPEGLPKTIALPGEGTKASPLYLDRALRAGLRDLVVVEGVFDAAVAQVRGDLRVVASVAAQFSGAQIETLVRRRVKAVFVCGDPDGGGDKGTLANLESLARAEIPAFAVPRLPNGLDPDDLINRDGIEAWRSHVALSLPGALFRCGLALGSVTPTSGAPEKREAIEKVLSVVASLRGPRAPLDREEVLRLAVERTGYSPETLEEVATAHEEQKNQEELGRAARRTLQDALGRIGDNGNVVDIVAETREKLSSLGAGVEELPPPFSVDRLKGQSKTVPVGLSSGWSALDAQEVAFSPGELAILAARTSHGKTTALVSLIYHWLQKEADGLVVFYSAEEAEVRIFHRLLALAAWEASRGGQDLRWTTNEIRDFYRGGLLSRGADYRWPRPDAIADAEDWLRRVEDRLLVVYRPGWRVDQLEDHAHEVARARPVAAVLVDYLQRIPPPAVRFDRRDQEISAVGRALKHLAVDLSFPVVVGAQINREAVPQGYALNINKAKTLEEALPEIKKARPELHHLREGGSEQEADLILGLLNYAADFRRDAEPKQETPPSTLFEVGVLKNRYGEVGTWAPLALEGRYGVLRDVEDGESSEWRVRAAPARTRTKRPKADARGAVENLLAQADRERE